MFTISSDHLKLQSEVEFPYFFQFLTLTVVQEMAVILEFCQQKKHVPCAVNGSYFGALSTKQTKVNNLAFFAKKAGN